MTFNKFFAACSIAATLVFSACKVSDPHEHNEEELITTVRIVVTDTLTGATDTVIFRDADGPGGSGPSVYDTLFLSPARTYRVALSFLDESDPGDIEDITQEIEEEAEDHQVFFTVDGANLTVTYADKDAKDRPIGLQTLQTTGTGSSGTLTVTLKHQPGLKNASSTIATGETDAEVVFQVRVASAGI